MRIFLTGGTGLVGSRLVKKLLQRGDEPIILTRRPEAAKALGEACRIVAGDPMQPGPWMDAVSGCDAVVHLAGEGIFNRRWTQEFKDLLYTSRVKSTDYIVAAMGKTAPASPKVLVNASAIGYYGPHGDEDLTEESAAGNDFLAKLCIDWEKAAQAASAFGVRVVTVRVGVVLDPAGGALAKLLTPFKMFVGGPIGAGQQYMSWIHNDDLCGLILFGLDHAEISGALNGTAPKPVTNKEFSRALGKALGRPSFLPTPGFALRVMLGEAANIITQGQKVLPRKALTAGYTFQFPELDNALRDLLPK